MIKRYRKKEERMISYFTIVQVFVWQDEIEIFHPVVDVDNNGCLVENFGRSLEAAYARLNARWPLELWIRIFEAMNALIFRIDR